MNFAFPMFLTCWHMTLATILTQIMSRTTSMLPAVQDNRVKWDDFKKRVIPIAVLFSISLIFSNKAYIYLSVSYIQMLKAFTPVAVLIFSYFAGLEKSSYIEVYIVLIICLGVAMTSMGETFFSLTGFTFQVIGILAESSRLVCVGMILKQLKLDPLSSLYYIAPVCSLFIGLCCIFFEGNELPFDRMYSQDFIIIMLLNGMVAFTLNVAVVLLISNTSPLTLTLAGVIKDILLVVLSVAIFGTPVTQLQYIGYGIALVGLNMHKQYKKNPDNISALLTAIATCGESIKNAA
jgi:drug/metabolite transporter (DMT)-like permease